MQVFRIYGHVSAFTFAVFSIAGPILDNFAHFGSNGCVRVSTLLQLEHYFQSCEVAAFFQNMSPVRAEQNLPVFQQITEGLNAVSMPYIQVEQTGCMEEVVASPAAALHLISDTP